MGFRNIGEVIAGFFATRPEGRRIEIDGTGDAYDEIRFYSGQADEIAPASVAMSSAGPGGGGIFVQANRVTGGATDPSYVSVASSEIFGAVLEMVSAGILNITSAGRMVVGPGGTDDLVLTSGGNVVLSPISGVVRMDGGARVKAGDLTPISLLNSWTRRPGAYNPPRFVQLADGLGMLSGQIAPGVTTNGVLLFVLPPELRPQAGESFEVPCSAAGKAMLQVDANGEVTLWNMTAGSGAISWVSLSGCIWPIAGY